MRWWDPATDCEQRVNGGGGCDGGAEVPVLEDELLRRLPRPDLELDQRRRNEVHRGRHGDSDRGSASASERRHCTPVGMRQSGQLCEISHSSGILRLSSLRSGVWTRSGFVKGPPNVTSLDR